MGTVQEVLPTLDSTLERAIELAGKIADCGPLGIKTSLASAHLAVDPAEAAALAQQRSAQALAQATYAGLLTGREAVRRMVPLGRGTVLFTGASASLRGKPQYAHFAAAKAALRMIAQSMAREFGPTGLHIGHVVIDGGVDGDILRTRWPAIVEARGEDGLLKTAAIAEDTGTYLTNTLLHGLSKSTCGPIKSSSEPVVAEGVRAKGRPTQKSFARRTLCSTEVSRFWCRHFARWSSAWCYRLGLSGPLITTKERVRKFQRKPNNSYGCRLVSISREVRLARSGRGGSDSLVE